MTYTYKYPRPSVTVDAVVFSKNENHFTVLLIQRKNEPYKDYWALPGGFIEMDEELEDAAKRELKEETGLDVFKLEQIGAFGKVGRDPRGRTISVAYTTIIEEPAKIKASSDAKEVKWFKLNELPSLAFDHDEIIQVAVGKVKS